MRCTSPIFLIDMGDYYVEEKLNVDVYLSKPEKLIRYIQTT